MHVPEIATDDIKRLPDWVKCMYCDGKPTKQDWLGEIIRYSNVLAHQSCAKQHGKVFGMNAGTIQEIDGKVKPTEGV